MADGDSGSGLLKPVVQVGALGIIGIIVIGTFWLAAKFLPPVVDRLSRTADAIEEVARNTEHQASSEERQSRLLQEQADHLRRIEEATDQTLRLITTPPMDRGPVRREIAEERENE